jgi:uncharacterized protein with HEPN domain
MKDDVVYLVHILECARRIKEDTLDGQEKFLASHVIKNAVLRNLQTLGESAKRISEDRKALHPEVERPRIVAFRNMLVHEYLGINLERGWHIAQQDVPPLKQAVAAMLGEIGDVGQGGTT